MGSNLETKKLGFLIIGMSIILGFIMFSFMGSLSAQSEQLHCNPTQECQQVNSVLGVSHIGIGFLAFIFALGFYLLFFNKSENQILEQYKKEIEELKQKIPQKEMPTDKFTTLLSAFDDNEKKILTAIKEQDGITQSTLRFRTDLSKSKISQVLSNFEKKNLIYRKEKGKTFAVFLKQDF